MNNEEKILAILEKHSELLTQMQEGQKQMQDDISSIKARLDYDVDVRLKATNETVDGILTQMDIMGKEVGEARKLAEETLDKVDVVHAAVTQHSAAISKLKKVQ